MRVPVELDPDVDDEAPTGDAITPYDEQQYVTYLRLLDAKAEGADWTEVARIVLHRDPVAEKERTYRCWEPSRSCAMALPRRLQAHIGKGRGGRRLRLRHPSAFARLDRVMQQEAVAAPHHLQAVGNETASLVLARIDFEILFRSPETEQDFGNRAIALVA